MKNETKVKLAWGAAFVAVPLLIAVPLWINNTSADPAALRRGHILDFCQALFSGWAFLGLIITLFYQREELGLQREELKLQREELRLNREEQERQGKTLAQQDAALHQQAKAMTRQAFESGFYQLLAAFTDARDAVDLSSREIDRRGALVFKILKNLLHECFVLDRGLNFRIQGLHLPARMGPEELQTWQENSPSKVDRETMLHRRMRLLQELVLNSTVSIHQRLLLTLLEVIRDAALSDDERLMYYKIVMSVMSREELLVSLYYTFGLDQQSEYLALIAQSDIFAALSSDEPLFASDIELAIQRAKRAMS